MGISHHIGGMPPNEPVIAKDLHRRIFIHYSCPVNSLAEIDKPIGLSLSKIPHHRMMLKEWIVMRITEHMLIEEIEFWQSMIESQQDSQSEQTEGLVRKICKKLPVGYFDIFMEFEGYDTLQLSQAIHEDQTSRLDAMLRKKE